MPFLSTFVGFLKRTVGLPGLVGLGVKRMVLRRVSPILSRIGYTASKIGSSLTEAGIKYAEPTFTKDIQLGDAAVKGEGGLPIDEQGVTYPISRLIETTMPSQYKYRGFAKVILEDKVSGVQRESWISFYDNKRRSQEEWTSMMGDWYKLSESEKVEDLITLEFQEVWHNEGEDY